MTAQRQHSGGRSGGRAGGAGYDYQDAYVAWQLARMLLGDDDPIVEVLWEKKAIDTGDDTEPVSVESTVPGTFVAPNCRFCGNGWPRAEVIHCTANGATAGSTRDDGRLD